MWPIKYFPPPSSLIIWKSLCWSLRYILLCSDLWYIYPENSLYFYSSCNDNNVEPVSYVFLTYFVAVCFMVYFDICLVYNRVTQSCIDYMWDVYQTEIIKCDSCSTVGKAHSSPQPPQMLSLCLLMPLNDSNIQICIQVSDSRCGACVCSCMQAKLNVCICDMMRSPRLFSSVKAAALFIRDSSSFTRGKLFANVSNAAEKPLTSENEIYTVLHNKE